VSRDVIFDKDVKSSSSQDSPSVIEKSEEDFPKTNLEIHDESNSSMDEGRLGLDMPSPSTLARKETKMAHSLDKGVDQVQVDVSVAEGFGVHERDSNVDKLLMALYRLLSIPQPIQICR